MVRVLFGLLLCLSLVVTSGCDSGKPPSSEGPRPSADAPTTPAAGADQTTRGSAPGQLLSEGAMFPFDFSVTDVTGQPISLADYAGQVVIVDIWGTWCPPCRAEIPSFIKLQDEYGPQGFQMVGLNYEGGEDTDAQIVRDFMAETGINYPCALGTEEIRAQVPNFQGFPTTLFLDKSGKVRHKAVGLHEYEYLESVVKALLAE